MGVVAVEDHNLTFSVDHSSASRIAKRGLDIVVAAIALVLLAPVIFVVALSIFLSSPGRVTFRQRRIGLHGECFNIIKFRSMVHDAEQRLETDPELHRIYLENDHKIPAEIDSRITRIGRFIRKTSLDELPQLWNILFGHMSLVGPRPVVPSEIVKYGECIPIYESVRPGLTGPWQASGRSNLPFHERVELDADYVLNWGFWTDVKIILKTVPAVLRSHGAH